MSDGDTFFERMDLAKELFGGKTKAIVNVDQVYARYQDGWGDPMEGDGLDSSLITPVEMSHGPRGKPGPAFDHPRGGEAGYLTRSLTESGPEYTLSIISAIDEETSMVDKIRAACEDLAIKVLAKAPREWWLLRNSASVRVWHNDKITYDRPALMPRASQAMLDMIRAASGGDLQHDNGEWQHLSDFAGGRLSERLSRGAQSH